MTEIQNLEDVKRLVDGFYEKVRLDPQLAPIFDDAIQERWPEHLEKMYRFWQTVLLGDHTYYGSPFAPHAKLPIQPRHFERWLNLFNQTIDEHFEGNKAVEAKWRAGQMARMFQMKLDHYRENPKKSLF